MIDKIAKTAKYSIIDTDLRIAYSAEAPSLIRRGVCCDFGFISGTTADRHRTPRAVPIYRIFIRSRQLFIVFKRNCSRRIKCKSVAVKRSVGLLRVL